MNVRTTILDTEELPPGEHMMMVSHAARIDSAYQSHKKFWELKEENRIQRKKDPSTCNCDQWYPAYHIAPPGGWLSVPHGLCFFNGYYHVFYQHNPFSTEWDNMHWGHCTSDDLVHWTHQPPALAPGSLSEGDRDGCFSGSAVSYKGTMYLFYTGHIWISADAGDQIFMSDMSDTNSGTSSHSSTMNRKNTCSSSNSPQMREGIYQQQCVAVSTDGIHFEKKGSILRPPKGYVHCRDPKVWIQEGRWFMVVGARDMDDQGLLLLYSSNDPLCWNSAKFTVLSKTSDKNVFMWECPDFFPFGNEFALFLCPQGLQPKGYNYRNSFSSCYTFGFFGDGKVFTESLPLTETDKGQDFYSPQTFVTPDGRRLLIGWLGSWCTSYPSSNSEGWTSLLTLPRELMRDPRTGKLRQTPPRELRSLRDTSRATPLSPCLIEDRSSLALAPDCGPLELHLVFQLNENAVVERYGVWFGRDAQLYVDAQSSSLVLARHYPEYFLCDQRSCPLDMSAAKLRLQVFIDKSCVEVFVNNGDFTLSARIYPEEEEGVSLFSIGGPAYLVEGTVYPLLATVSSCEVVAAAKKQQHISNNVGSRPSAEVAGGGRGGGASQDPYNHYPNNNNNNNNNNVGETPESQTYYDYHPSEPSNNTYPSNPYDISQSSNPNFYNNNNNNNNNNTTNNRNNNNNNNNNQNQNVRGEGGGESASQSCYSLMDSSPS